MIAIEQSDIALLLIDANELSVALDQKIAGMIDEAGKGLILVVSKWDSVDKDAYTHDKMMPRVQADFVNDPDSKPVKSGKDGSVTLKVRNQGLNVIVATFDAPPDDPVKSSKIEHVATLSFVLPHKPE